MDRQTLVDQNAEYKGTMGVSTQNRTSGFVPAFRDEENGDVVLACYASGELAPMHMIVGLPRSWATEFDAEGNIKAIRPTITAGFVRDNQFFTRDQASEASKS